MESVSQILPHYLMLWYIKTYLFASLTRRGRYAYNDLTAIFKLRTKDRRLNEPLMCKSWNFLASVAPLNTYSLI